MLTPGGSGFAALHSYLTIDTPIDKSGNYTPEVDGAGMGTGFDSVKVTFLGPCIEQLPTTTLTGGNGQQITYDAKQITSTAELITNTEFNTKVKLSFGDIFTGGATLKLAFGKHINEYDTNIMAVVTVRQQEQVMSQFLLQKWVLDRIQHDPAFVSSGEFGKLCGDRFVSGFRTGGQLVLLFSRSNSSLSEKQQVEAGLEAKVLSYLEGNASLKNEIEQKLGRDNIHLSIWASGAVIPLPNLDNVLDVVQHFPEQVDKAKGWPLEVRVTPYTMVENYPVDSPRNWQADRVLQTLADRRAKILPIYFDDLYISNNKAAFDLDAAAFAESLATATSSLKAIENAARSCYEQDLCEVPVPLPAIPRAPVAATTPDVATEYKAVWRQFPECQHPGERQQVGTSSENCPVFHSCSSVGRWEAPIAECLCHNGEAKSCACPECGSGRSLCHNNAWGSCQCNKTCPDGFSPDGAICSVSPVSVGYQSWTCGTPEGATFLQINVPAECADTANYDCEIEYNLNDKKGSCDNAAFEDVVKFECDGTEFVRYNAAQVAGGYHDRQPLPTGCRNYVRANKVKTAAGTCFYGCVRYISDLSVKVKTKSMCTF